MTPLPQHDGDDDGDDDRDDGMTLLLGTTSIKHMVPIMKMKMIFEPQILRGLLFTLVQPWNIWRTAAVVVETRFYVLCFYVFYWEKNVSCF